MDSSPISTVGTGTPAIDGTRSSAGFPPPYINFGRSWSISLQAVRIGGPWPADALWMLGKCWKHLLRRLAETCRVKDWAVAQSAVSPCASTQAPGQGPDAGVLNAHAPGDVPGAARWMRGEREGAWRTARREPREPWNPKTFFVKEGSHDFISYWEPGGNHLSPPGTTSPYAMRGTPGSGETAPAA